MVFGGFVEQTLCKSVNCGLKLTNTHFCSFVERLTEYVVFALDSSRNRYHKLIGYYDELDLRDYYGRKLISEDESKFAINILFEGIDFSKVKSEGIKFYDGCARFLLPSFFDAKNNQALRNKYKMVIRNLEQRVASVQDEFVRKELTKILFLSVGEYHSKDWNELEAKYSMSDKMFLNDIWSKYGRYHPANLFYIIYLMHIGELLPDVLLPIRDTLKCLKDEGGDKLREIIHANNTAFRINKIISKALVDFNEVIKSDSELIEAYEQILEILDGANFEGAGVMLDEFRYH